ncbi:ComF family protein [Massilia sp. S19_KUP03_FR1]|uniref:ComF family protein n=1 Tax=Massilia sp. S19_KUP03_FR1 TaxID=3025503 RepID=UPI002FCD0556
MDSQGLWQWPQRASRALLTAVADVLLPSSCALCAGPCKGVLCAPCRSQYTLARRRCLQCANPLAAHEPVVRCGACIKATPGYDATVAAVDYAAPFDALVLQLKFGAQLALAPMCAQLVRDAMLGRAGLDLPDVLCPVPLGPRRLVERGFNQALEIARPLARALGVPLDPRLLARPVDTPAQSTMTPAARRDNVRRAFVACGDVEGKHVGVVDDVMTSGQTLHAVARTLKRAGAARVTNLVFARTPPHD